MKIIFLDMDGVLNSNDWWERRTQHGDERDLFENNIDPQAVARLNCIIAATGAKVVISSTWRKYHDERAMQRMLNDCGFIGEVIDRTVDLWANPELWPDPRRFGREFERGHEIRHWLVENTMKLGVKSYVVLDDSSDMATVEHRFVQTDHAIGLSQENVAEAIDLLSIDGDLVLERAS